MKLPRWSPAIVVTSVLLLGIGALAWRFISSGDSTIVVTVKLPELSQQAREGKQAFDANCARCHGTNAAGSRKGPPLVHDIYNPGHHGDAAFFLAAKRGVPRHHWTFGDMPRLERVTDQDLAAIVRYVRELQEANGIFYREHKM